MRTLTARLRPTWVLAAIMVVSTLATVFAMRRNSTTFDEIVLIAGGARGYHTGHWDLAPEHPPLTQYVYGLLPFLSKPHYPDERGAPPPVRGFMSYRYRYSEVFFWASDNDPEKLAFLGRLPAVLFALLLTLAAFTYTRRYYGDWAGVTAAAMVAFTPDVLAHGGVAYNDIAIALMFFAAMWLLDAAIRVPTVGRALVAGAITGVALGTKNSGVGLGLVAVLLLAAEAATRWRDKVWRVQVAMAGAVATVAAYVALVVIYRGDFRLEEWQYALGFVFNQVSDTHAPAYLLGRAAVGGIWYYFPVAFLFKTSAALHVLLVLAIVYYATRIRSVRQIISSPLRAPLVAAAVFGYMLARSQLDLGFRYALPVLPLICVLCAPALTAVWSQNWQRLRPIVGAALVWLVISPLTYYPNFLTYVSEYGPGRDRNYEVFADSSLDWGQGLLQLRDFMHRNHIDRVYFSYFGSAWPSGYGIDYVPLLSFYMLPPRIRPAPAPPRWVAISATNLTGAYFGGDPFRNFRNQQPDFVIANSIYLYRVSE